MRSKQIVSAPRWGKLRSPWPAVMLLPVLLVAATPGPATAKPVADAQATAQDAGPLPENYSCTECHKKNSDFLPDSPELWISVDQLVSDVHWQHGLRCHDCHGGNPVLTEFKPHRDDPSFHSLGSPKDIPDFCGRCHSDLEYMRRYAPSARTDQESEYWTSGHGQRLKESDDPEVATCVSCHGHHGILAVDDLKSPVYPTHLAETCAKCHANAKIMDKRTYHGQPLGHSQYEQWRGSVHGKALLDKGDLSAPTCNDCHGNHGALPPEVGSVANACGTCHGKIAGLFAETQMKHSFEKVGLPGCATCHGSHAIHSPSDEMLGMQETAVCVKCHENNRYGATLAGANVARTLRTKLDQLKEDIQQAEAKVADAERLGMEVSGPRFDLRQADDSLTNARSLIHSFSVAPVEKAIDQGLGVADQVKAQAAAALAEHRARRIWLAASLAPILIVVALLLLYIRTLSPTTR